MNFAETPEGFAPELPTVAADVTRARTLPGAVHGDERFYGLVKERILVGSWNHLTQIDQLPKPGDVYPVDLFPGSLDEPAVLTRCPGVSQGSAPGPELQLLSNVCTHRANLVVREAGACRELRCNYHGRRFTHAGSLRASPGFEGARNFPDPTDDLRRLDCARLGPLIFGSLNAALPFGTWMAPVLDDLDHLPWDRLRPMPSGDRDFDVQASWILYVENYLEGFHVPFVHPGLSNVIDLAAYSYELLPWGTRQVARARPGEAALPSRDGESSESGKSGGPVAAYYVWLFPGIMLNVYPWGLSLNAVEPLGVDRTRVRFRCFVWDESLLEQGAGANLEQIEYEDEQVVEACQRGNVSRTYDRGRYAPQHEAGTHRFHRLLLEVLRTGWDGADQRA